MPRVTQTLLDIFPTIYRPLLPDFFHEPAPREEKATCDDCAMARKDGPSHASDEITHFRPDAKCCTFHPQLPSYLVGAILSDTRPDMAEGVRRIRERIAARIGITPRWISPPRKWWVLYSAARRSSFGRSLLLRCPYFEADGGLCTIWRHRESTCSTFFCKYSAGADGQHFWKNLRLYLRDVESRLTAHALQIVGPGLVEPQITPGELTIEEFEDKPPTAALYSSIWRDWEGREEEYYRRCHEVIMAMTASESAALLSSSNDGVAKLEEVKAAYRSVVSPTLPERLMANSALNAIEGADGVVVKSYSQYDPMMLTPALYDVVRAFDGTQTVAETTAKLEREMGVEIPEGLLITLYQLRILVVPPAVNT